MSDEHSKIKTNHGYVMFFMLTFLLSTSFQCGWTLAECSQVSLVLDKKLGWNAIIDEKEKSSSIQLVNKVTIITMLGPLGIAFGSLFGGLLLPKWGSRKLVIVTNLISIIANVFKLWEHTIPIMLGRFVFSLMCGIQNVCISITISDTVPVKNQQQYGVFVNLGFGIGIFASNLLGFLIPLDNGEDGDVQKILDDKNWRVVFGMPLLFEIFGILMLLFVIKHESIINLLQKESSNSTLLIGQLKKIYTVPDSMTYEALAIKLKGEIKVQEADPTTIWEALTHKKLRRASWIALIYPIFHQVSGIIAVQLFQTQIFLKMKRSGDFAIPVIWGVNISMFINVVSSSLYPFFSKYYRQKQALMFSQIGLTISLFGIVLFKQLNQNMMILLAMNCLICFFQYGVGSILVVHIFETNVDSIIGLGNFMLFIYVTIVSLITPLLLDLFSEIGTFSIYGVGSLLGIFFTYFIMRPTNKFIKDQHGKQEILSLSQKDKKELYWPENFQSGTPK